jgi:rhodanese-related sulfurtransferase
MTTKFKLYLIAPIIAVFMAQALPAVAAEDMAGGLNEVLVKGLEESNWQETADEIYMWIKTNKTDFLVVDVRPGEKGYSAGHIPGAIHIPYNDMLTTVSLKRLPKDKKIILVCATGQLANLPVVPLRALGYDAYTMMFGYAAWAKGFGGGEMMKVVVEKANSKNYPMEK